MEAFDPVGLDDEPDGGEGEATLDDLCDEPADAMAEGSVFAASALVAASLAAGIAFVLVPLAGAVIGMADTVPAAAARVIEAKGPAGLDIVVRSRTGGREVRRIVPRDGADELLSTLFDRFSTGSGRWLDGPAEGGGDFVELTAGRSKCHMVLHVGEAKKLPVALHGLPLAH